MGRPKSIVNQNPEHTEDQMEHETKAPASRPEKYKDTILLSFDIGFGFLKGMSSANHLRMIKLPSFVELAPNNVRSSIKGKKTIEADKLTVIVDGKEYRVGEFASNIPDDKFTNRVFNHDRGVDPYSKAMFLSMIGLLLPNENFDYEIIIATGLPTDDFQKDIYNHLMSFLEGITHITYKLNNTTPETLTKFVTVKQVYLYPQPEGTLYDFCYMPNGEPPSKANNFALGIYNHDLFKMNIGIIDIGHGSLDCSIYNRSQIDASKNIQGEGFNRVYDNLAAKLTATLVEHKMSREFHPKDRDLDKILLTGVFQSKVQDINVQHIIKEVCDDYAAYIFNYLMDKWKGEINRLDLFILSGGAAEIISEPLNRLLLKNKFIQTEMNEDTEMNQYLNCRGFYLHAMLDAYADELLGNDPQIYWELFIKPMNE